MRAAGAWMALVLGGCVPDIPEVPERPQTAPVQRPPCRVPSPEVPCPPGVEAAGAEVFGFGGAFGEAVGIFDRVYLALAWVRDPDAPTGEGWW